MILSILFKYMYIVMEKRGENKMVIIGKTSFPPESAKDVGKRFIELPPLPEFMTSSGPYIKSMGESNINCFEIFDMDKSKLAEGYEFVTNRLVSYFGIPGYKYEVNVYMEATEALGMIGLGQ